MKSSSGKHCFYLPRFPGNQASIAAAQNLPDIEKVSLSSTARYFSQTPCSGSW